MQHLIIWSLISNINENFLLLSSTFSSALKIIIFNSYPSTLLVDVSETSAAVYILVFSSLSFVSLSSLVHDNSSFFNSKVEISNLVAINILCHFVYSKSNRIISPKSKFA